MTVFLVISSQRTENTEANLPESQEFLSGTEDKKMTRFTDVSLNTNNNRIIIICNTCKHHQRI